MDAWAFVVDDDGGWVLSVNGSNTQWFLNIGIIEIIRMNRLRHSSLASQHMNQETFLHEEQNNISRWEARVQKNWYSLR